MGNLTNMGNSKTFNQFAVIGDPIEHSLSPILHNEVFQQLNLNAQYEKIQLPSNDLTDFVKVIPQKNLTGFNITIPHKTEILSYLDHINPRAKEIGAVNCVVNRNNKLWGFNTDWYGFSMLLKKNAVEISMKSILILGAGGVAYSVLYSLIFANIYIPEDYKVINKESYAGAEAIQGYLAYKMNMKRKYRDVLSAEDFIITPSVPGEKISASPILVHFENMKQRLHTDKTFVLSSIDNKIQLNGPEQSEATYPQQLGM